MLRIVRLKKVCLMDYAVTVQLLLLGTQRGTGCMLVSASSVPLAYIEKQSSLFFIKPKLPVISSHSGNPNASVSTPIKTRKGKPIEKTD